MNRYFIALCFILFSAITPLRLHSQHYKITVTIKGLNNNKGKVLLTLYNQEDGYPQDAKKAFRGSSGTINDNTCTVILADIPKGTYAIACFHDENDNGKLDTNFMGIPTEGVGASNNARGVFGPPKYKDAKFELSGDRAMTITVSH
jgi:uncharacterized protein (DUF2141 family)